MINLIRQAINHNYNINSRIYYLLKIIFICLFSLDFEYISHFLNNNNNLKLIVLSFIIGFYSYMDSCQD